MEQLKKLEPTNICSYWRKNPAFHPKRVLLCRLFFINEDRTRYVSVGFYSARDYLPLVEFGVFRRCGGPKTLILSNIQVEAMAEGFPCYGTPCLLSRRVLGCESGAFRLDVTRSRHTARLYVDSHYISLTLQDIDYLSRMFSDMQQQLRDYIGALQDVLPNVTATLTSVTYVKPSPDANKNIKFPNLYKDLITFV